MSLITFSSSSIAAIGESPFRRKCSPLELDRVHSAVDDRSSILGLRRFLNQIFNGSITMPNLIIHVVSCLSCEFCVDNLTFEVHRIGSLLFQTVIFNSPYNMNL